MAPPAPSAIKPPGAPPATPVAISTPAAGQEGSRASVDNKWWTYKPSIPSQAMMAPPEPSDRVFGVTPEAGGTVIATSVQSARAGWSPESKMLVMKTTKAGFVGGSWGPPSWDDVPRRADVSI